MKAFFPLVSITMETPLQIWSPCLVSLKEETFYAANNEQHFLCHSVMAACDAVTRYPGWSEVSRKKKCVCVSVCVGQGGGGGVLLKKKNKKDIRGGKKNSMSLSAWRSSSGF